jgi:hypothetical protein
MRLDNHTQEVNDMSGVSQHLRQAATLLVLMAIVGLGAASAMAARGSPSAAKPFELVFNGAYEFDDVAGAIWLA